MNLNGNPGATPRKFCITMILAITGLLVVIAPSLSAMAAAQSKASFIISNVLIQANNDSEQTSTEKTVETLVRLARAEIKAGNTDAGKAILQNVLVLDPRNADAKEELNALADQGASLSVDTKIAQSGTPARNLSSAQLLDVARSQMGDGDYAGARATLEAAKGKNPTANEKKQIEQFITAIDRNKEEIAEVAQTQLDYNLSELEKQINKALVYMESGQFDKAEIELHRAQQISPDDKRVTALLNQIYSERGNMQKQGVAMSDANMKAKNSQLQAVADTLFQEGVVLYKQNQVIEAVDKWMQAVEILPEHQAAQTYLTNTRVEYDQAVKAREMAEKMAKQEAGYEKMLDTAIPQYSTQGDLIDVKDVLSTLISFTSLNLAMDENLSGNVALEMKNSSFREILNVIQKQYGFVWTRDGNTIYVKPGFKTRVFALTDGQYKTLDLILSDPTSVADTSRNLKNILYGPQEEFNVPGKQLYLSQSTRSLNITDTEENIRKVEAFLNDMPEIIGETQPVELGIYKIRKEISRDIFEIIRVTLYGEQDPIDVRDNRRKLVLEPKSAK
jgi:tetratricopeptide (TPR) repeat protein